MISIINRMAKNTCGLNLKQSFSTLVDKNNNLFMFKTNNLKTIEELTNFNSIINENNENNEKNINNTNTNNEINTNKEINVIKSFNIYDTPYTSYDIPFII